MTRKPDTIIIPKGKPLSIEVALGLVVRERREELGLNQSDLELSGIISRSYVSRVEHGASEVSIGRFVHLAEALDYTPVQLMQALTDRMNQKC